MSKPDTKCPVCGMPSATNATDDLRCAPCYNFKLTGFDGWYEVTLRVDFNSWLSKLTGELMAAGTLSQYRSWLQNLRGLHEVRVATMLADKEEVEARHTDCRERADQLIQRVLAELGKHVLHLPGPEHDEILYLLSDLESYLVRNGLKKGK